MISSRFLSRSAPRIVSRLASPAIRRPIALPISSFRTAYAPSRLTTRAAFSTSLSRKASAGESDAELIAKLENEIHVEEDLKSDVSTPTSINDFLENGPFKVQDTPGIEEVVLTRDFGDEKIRVSFSISDLNAMADQEPDYNQQDSALGDEEGMSSENINQGDKHFKQAAEEQISAADNEGQEIEQSEGEQSFPSGLNITIEKPGKGCLTVEATAQDGMIIIENVGYYKNIEHALARSAEKSHERDELYVGPPFGNLDEDLQVLIERYLDERGINAALAVFVPDYIDMKEQKEYERWLKSVKGFLEA